MFRSFCFAGTTACVSTASLWVFTQHYYRPASCKMSTFDRAKDEAQRIADDMRRGANEVKSSFKQSTEGKSYSYSKLTQQLRLGSLVVLPFQAISLYFESHRFGIFGFLFPLTFIITDAYLIFTKWQKQVDGRRDVENFFGARDPQVKARIGLQLLGPFLFALLVHMISPTFVSYLGSLFFGLADYALIATTLACLILDCFEVFKNKIH